MLLKKLVVFYVRLRC